MQTLSIEERCPCQTTRDKDLNLFQRLLRALSECCQPTFSSFHFASFPITLWKKSWLFRMNWSLDGVGATSLFSCLDPIPCGLYSCRSKVYFCPISPWTLFCMHCRDFHGKWVLASVHSSSKNNSTIWSSLICVRMCFMQPEGAITEKLSE